MTEWHDIYHEDIPTYDLPNFCEIVLVELRSGDRQVAQLDINPWTRVPGWCIPNGKWLGPIDIVKRWMEIQD